MAKQKYVYKYALRFPPLFTMKSDHRTLNIYGKNQKPEIHKQRFTMIFLRRKVTNQLTGPHIPSGKVQKMMTNKL